jgi:GNAT superfamily N-acetyltransferase
VLPPGSTDVTPLDALVLTGGGDLGSDPARDAGELALLAAARRAGIPTLGVCRGLQLMAAETGGSLVEELGDDHVIAPPGTHDLRTLPGAVVAGLVPDGRVGSLHHQAVATYDERWRCTATAPDGVVEALEWADQAAWHDGHRGHVPDALVAARDRAYFEARSAELLDHVTVAVEGGELLGVVIVVADELQQLMVTAGARGRGVGGTLLTAAEERVRAAGHGEIWLAVVPGNTTARRFYAAHGWVDRGAETYDAATLAGATVPVPVRRYVKEL